MKLLSILIFISCVSLVFAKPTPTKKLIHLSLFNNRKCGGNPHETTYVDQQCYLNGKSSIYMEDKDTTFDMYYCIDNTDCSDCSKPITYKDGKCKKVEGISELVTHEKKTLDTARVVNQLNYQKSDCSDETIEASYIEGECYRLLDYGSVYGVIVKDTVEVFFSKQEDCKNATPKNYKLNECVKNEQNGQNGYVKYVLVNQ
ncbi:hypothetical protein M0812_07397 [Anaeramoeba flamelloides]|uniref:Uncharacterized protein n=1 Tax=Anaeramoeba flamelloides TaxID=1746091 RepID=A0AAV8A553_9EUKA|nr:hypothetical protein M0812_07397 [Anaeramoeba flamelloides]